MTYAYFSWPTAQAIAQLEADGWRGRCVQLFAQVEIELTDTLALLHRANSQFHLAPSEQFQAKLKRLKGAVSESGLFASEGRGVREPLAVFLRYYAKRTLLVHASAKTSLVKGNSWSWAGRFVPVGEVEPIGEQFTKAEALQFETSLRDAATHLGRQMKCLCTAVLP